MKNNPIKHSRITAQKTLLAVLGVAIVIVLYLFGNTVPPKENVVEKQEMVKRPVLESKDLIAKAKEQLSPAARIKVGLLEKSIDASTSDLEKIRAYLNIAAYWKDSTKTTEPFLYYNAEAAKLDNSEKNLTFAARLFLDYLFSEDKVQMQQWLATNAKQLLDKALVLDPKSDSIKIGIGACYILGNISENPMEGILPVKAIADKNPDNLYAQYVLGMGGRKSGQYEKAIDRFSTILHKQPNDLDVMFQIAECYDLKGDRENAIKWYSIIKDKINNIGYKKELESRINRLKQ